MIQEIRKQMEAIVYIIATNSSWRFFSLEYLIQNTIESPARIENSASTGTRENTMASINEAIAIRQTATSQPVCIADLDISKSATSIPFISFRLFSSISSFVIIPRLAKYTWYGHILYLPSILVNTIFTYDVFLKNPLPSSDTISYI